MSSRAQRLRAASDALDRDQRFAAGAAIALLAAMFLPWYEKSVVIPGSRSFVNDSISAFGAVSFVEAAIFLVAAGVLALLLARADERPFHLPGGDGTVIFAAGLWATALIFYRVFDRPDVSGDGGTVGIQWGFFFAFLAAAALALAGCRIPEDPDGTLDRVEGGTMRVGVTSADPWVELRGAEPSGGIEVELVRRFARDLGAGVEWVDGSEEELVAALKDGSLDLVIAGITSKSRWEKEVAFTRPYATSKIVVGAPGSRRLGEELGGVRVAAELGSEAEALLERRTDATVVPALELAGVSGPAAVEDDALDDLGLRETGIELKKDRHVMAVIPGENAWMVRLERFLLNREDEIERLVRREGKP